MNDLICCVCVAQSPEQSPQQSPQLDKRDIPLMTRLHARIKDLEKDKARLLMDLDRRDYRSDIFEGSAEHSEMEIYDALRVCQSFGLMLFVNIQHVYPSLLFLMN